MDNIFNIGDIVIFDNPLETVILIVSVVYHVSLFTGTCLFSTTSECVVGEIYKNLTMEYYTKTELKLKFET